MRYLLQVGLVVALAAGAACGPKAKTLGRAPKEPVSTVLAIQAGDAPGTLSLVGTMTEKCPQAGCWFRLDDGTGVIKVDTKAAGFVVSEIPLNHKVKVAGTLVRQGDETELQAIGVAY